MKYSRKLFEYADFKPTVPWMDRMFRELNARCFSGSLPPCKTRIARLARNTLGNFAPHASSPLYTRPDGTLFYKEKVTVDGRTAEFPFPVDGEWISGNCSPVISLSSVYSMNEKAWTSVLLHEMCHYAVFMSFRMDPTAVNRSHGPLFRKACEDAARKMGTGWTPEYIESSEQLEDVVDDDAARAEAARIARGYVVMALYNRTPSEQVAMCYLTKEWPLVQELYAFSRRDTGLTGIAYLDDKVLYSKLALRYKTSRQAFSGNSFTAGFNSLMPECVPVIEEIKRRPDLKIILDRSRGIDANIELGSAIRKGPFCHTVVTEDSDGQVKLYLCLKNDLNRVLEDIASYMEEDGITSVRVYDDQDLAYTLVSFGMKRTKSGYGSRYDVTKSERVAPLLDRYGFRDMTPKI